MKLLTQAKQSTESILLAIAFVVALAWSAGNVARLFGANGWLIVVGMCCLLTVAVLRANRKEWAVFLVATGSALVSVFANTDYALNGALGGAVLWKQATGLDNWQLMAVAIYGSPPLLPYAVYWMARSRPVAEQLPSLAPPPSTQLAVGNPPTPANPSVNVAKPEPEPAPTPPPLLASHQPELVDISNNELASWQVGNPPLQGTPLPQTDLDHDLAQAVILYQQEGSYAKAAARLGGKITAEGMRQRVINAYKDDPEWVAEILPADKLPKV